MPSIQSLGVGSGLLTSELVEEIIAAEREATDLRLNARKAEFEAKISAFGAIQSSLDAVISASGSLGTSTSLLSNVVTSTNEAAVGATADASAIPGIHTVEVLASARAHSLTSVRYDSVDEVIGDGTIDIRFGATTFSGGNYDTFTENADRASAQITIDSSNNTLSGIRDAINTADSGVIASIVNDGQGFVLVLTSDQTGENHSMELVVTEGATAGLSAFAFNSAENTPGTNLTQTVDADDATIVIDGITVTRETNSVDEVIPGVTFNVLATNAGVPATVTVSQDTAAITERMQSFVDAFNSLKSLTDQLTDFDEDEEVGALLTGDSTVRGLMSQLNRFMVRSVDDIESSSLRALIDLGISSNQNSDFQLSFNAATFQTAISQSPQDVLAMLADQSRSSDSQIEFTTFTKETVAGSFDVNITQAAQRAALTGAAVAGLAGPTTIDADNDTLSITVDGVASGVVNLAQATYADGNELALEIESQINQDSALRAANKTVEVTFDDATQQFSISSTLYGANSNIGIDTVDTNTTTDLGLMVDPASNNTGQNVSGTINGISGVGSGQFLSIPSGPVAATSGTYKGEAISSFDTPPLTIDGSNDTFRVSVDGIVSDDIVLTAGTYNTPEELASEIQTQINADTTLINSDLSTTVRFDTANQRFEISSASTGSASSANVTFATAGVVSDLGLSVASGVNGKNATSIADPASGIQIRVQGTAIGERGAVTLVRGVMNQIDTFLKNFVASDGGLSNKLDALDDSVTEIDTEAADHGRRMTLLEERLRFQFAAADALISTLNNTSQFLDQQLATLPGYTREN